MNLIQFIANRNLTLATRYGYVSKFRNYCVVPIDDGYVVTGLFFRNYATRLCGFSIGYRDEERTALIVVCVDCSEEEFYEFVKEHFGLTRDSDEMRNLIIFS